MAGSGASPLDAANIYADIDLEVKANLESDGDASSP
jgi:hypothetical protein